MRLLDGFAIGVRAENGDRGARSKEQTIEKPEHCVVVVESKGKHLEGNPDTEYKREIVSYFSDVGRKVSWQQLGNDFHEHVFRFQVLDEAQDFGRDWSDELRDLLASPC
jgi:hypothetical protein